jgi:hypothetical protein
MGERLRLSEAIRTAAAAAAEGTCFEIALWIKSSKYLGKYLWTLIRKATLFCQSKVVYSLSLSL